MNLFAVLVGETATSRKGTSWAQVIRIMRAVDPNWAQHCVIAGLWSGEGFISAVSDRQQKKKKRAKSQSALDMDFRG